MRSYRSFASIASLTLGGLITLSGCGSSNKTPTPPPVTNPAPSGLSYPSPQIEPVGVAINSITPTVTGTVTTYSVTPSLPSGLSLNATSGVITGTPSTPSALAAYTVTASNTTGSTTAALNLGVADGPPDTEGMTAPPTSQPQVIQVSDMVPASGETVSITISVANATSIDLAAAGTGCGTIASQNVSASSLDASGTVAAAGQCLLTAAVTVAGVTTNYTAQITVNPINLPAQAGAINFPGGGYFPSGDISSFPQSSTLTIQSLNAPQTVINGGTGTILVATNNPADVTRAIVSIDGIPGYYIAPVSVVNGQVQVAFQISSNFLNLLQAQARATDSPYPKPQLRVGPRAIRTIRPYNSAVMPKRGATGMRYDLAATTTQTTLNFTVSLLSGTDYTASAAATASSTVQGVGTGPIQTSLTWNAPVDVDLHVVTPSGEEIFYDNRSDSTGGSLDLDSNAGCSIDNVDNENIVWPNTATPAAGTYTVRVDYWSNCGNPSPIPFTVRIVNCGQVTNFSGTLNAGDADAGGQGAGTTITTFNYQPCSGLSATGHATYEDISPTTSGLKSTPVIAPIKNATIEVHKQSDDSLLATTATDETGYYQANFSMSTPGQYYVKVLSQQVASDGSTVIQQTVNTSGTVYSAKSSTIDASTTPAATGVDIKSTQQDSSAPAFNAIQVGGLGFVKAKAIYGISLPKLTWLWTPGTITCASGTNFGSCYLNSKVSVNGVSDANHGNDANNNSVLAHEFGHFVNENAVLRKAAPGGQHGWDSQAVPGLAFSEGLATFWGQNTLGTSVYIQALTGRTFYIDLETPNTTGSTYPTGTSDGTQAGNVSETWVAATLWDLADSTQDSRVNGATTYTDTIANSAATFASLSKLKSTTHNRGGADLTLVDQADQWLCSGYSKWNTSPASDFYDLVVGLNQFPYSPDAPTATPPVTNCN